MVADLVCIVLAGGAGTRIRHLFPDLPKPLIPVAGRPFLDWICRFWMQLGIRELIISAGYRAEAIVEYVAGTPHADRNIHVIREDQPLGTGGAIFSCAQSAFCTDPFLAVNGDSLVIGDLTGALPVLAREDVDGVLVGVHVADASRFGTLRFDQTGRLVGFEEKRPGEGWINGGVYFLKRRLLPLFPKATPLSMEHEVFPALIRAGANLQVLLIEGSFLDIGTPAGLRLADSFIRTHLKHFEGRNDHH